MVTPHVKCWEIGQSCCPMGLLALWRVDMDPLERIAIALESRSMGFGNAIDRVYIKADVFNGWYRLNGEDREPIPFTSVTGVIRRLTIDKVSRDGEDAHKMHLGIFTGESLVLIESGHLTFFSRSVYAAIAIMNKEQLTQRISLCVRPGKKAVFAEFLDHQGFVINAGNVDSIPRDKWRNISEKAIKAVGRG